MTIHPDLLKSIPYFHGLNDSVLALVGQHVFEKKAERGEILSFEGAPSDTLYFVVSGVVKEFKISADGKEQIFRIIRPGDSFNEVPVLSGGVNLASAAAMSAVVLSGIKKKDLENFIREQPQVALNLVKVLSRRVEELISLVEDFSFRHVSGRVAKILLEYTGGASGENPRLTQQEIAAVIGTAREMVGRSLKNLEMEGAIKMERNRIVITSKESLKKIAGLG
ncbi:MAG: Crp/Fnr family transcriptional regulator [Dehalococcoidales bacterium]|jgi:CRP/FNR family transcriptional regulator